MYIVQRSAGIAKAVDETLTHQDDVSLGRANPEARVQSHQFLERLSGRFGFAGGRGFLSQRS